MLLQCLNSYLGFQIVDFIVSLFHLFIYLVLFIHLFFSAVKRLIVINRIQNKSFCLHNICVCTVCTFIMYVQIHTHACIYLRKICYICILNIFIYII